MSSLDHLFEQNRIWSEKLRKEDPAFFQRLAELQNPEYLWIGCSDSRVPANQISGLLPGEVFVHRNIANQVVHSDLNCLSVLQFAVDVLKVKHILVVGHHGCGGVRAALERQRIGLADNWLRHIQNTQERHKVFFDSLADPADKFQRLCEVNIVEQVLNVCHTTVVRDAWERGQALEVHGWVFSLNDGILHDLKVTSTNHPQCHTAYNEAIQTIYQRT